MHEGPFECLLKHLVLFLYVTNLLRYISELYYHFSKYFISFLPLELIPISKIYIARNMVIQSYLYVCIQVLARFEVVFPNTYGA